MVSKFLLVSVTLARLYVIGVRRTGDALEKKLSENLVDSKSCRTFAFATPKKGWSEVSDARLEIGYDDI